MSPDFDDVADGCTGKAAPSPRNIWTIPKGEIAVHNMSRATEPSASRSPQLLEVLRAERVAD
jgi:hypothetical protein